MDELISLDALTVHEAGTDSGEEEGASDNGLLAEGSARQLLELLMPVAGTIPKKPLADVLKYALLERSAWDVKVTTSDLAVICTNTARLGTDSGHVWSVIDIKGIIKVLKGLDRNEFVRLVSDGAKTRCSRSGCNYTFAAMPGDEFPRWAEPDGSIEIPVKLEVSARDMNDALGSILKAMADKDIRTYLNGCHIELGRGSAALKGTNGAWLAVAEIASIHQPEHEGVGMLLPRASVLSLLQLTKNFTGPVRITLDGKPDEVGCRIGCVELRTRLNEGKYPDFSSILATRDGGFASFDIQRQEAVGALRRLKPMASESLESVILQIADGRCRMTVSNEGDQCTEEVLVAYTGSSLEVAFNINYLIDLLETVVCDSATITLTAAGPEEETDWGITRVGFRTSPRFLAAIMPMRLATVREG